MPIRRRESCVVVLRVLFLLLLRVVRSNRRRQRRRFMRRILYASSIASGHRCVLCFFFNDLKNSTFFLWAEKGVLSLLHQKDTQIPMRVSGLNNCAHATRKRRTLNLFNKYLFLHVNICFTQFCVRFSNPSFASLFLLLRARKPIAFFFEKSGRLVRCRRFGTGGFEFLR